MGCAQSRLQHMAIPCVVDCVGETGVVEIAAASPTSHAPRANSHGKAPAGPTDSTQPGSSRASTKSAARPTSPSAESSISMDSIGWSQPQTRGRRVVLGRYALYDKGRPLGEGSSSVCYEGRDLATGERVAIKAYKAAAHSTEESGSKTAAMFRRQVSVLRELQSPFERPSDDHLWCPELAALAPSDLFVQLLDHSRDASGAPGPDPADGSMYVVTEFAEKTLQGMLAQHFEQSRPLPEEQVRKIAREVTLAVAGLHAKGLVHLDVKPENVMLCGGRWKLIDMDGCCRVGTILRLGTKTVSFSPCYCSPEFAGFATQGDSIVATPALDVWSVGMTIAELVDLCPLLRATYLQLARGRGRREASARFLGWLSRQRAAPKLSRPCSSCFRELLKESLLVPKQANRRTLAESLSSPFYRDQGARSVAPKNV